MGLSIDWCEPISQSQPLAKPFGLNANGVPMHEVLRLLTGSVDLSVDGQRLRLTNNELRNFRGRSSAAKRYTSQIFDSQLTVEEYASFLLHNEFKNSAFFKSLKGELSLCLLAKKQARYSESFLYLYRIVEHISMAFPMLYALTHDEFRNSYSFLRSLLNNDKEGELKVLSTAMRTLANSSNLSALTFDFSVSGLSVDYISNLRSELEAAVMPKVAMDFEDHGDILFRIAFNNMPSFFVTVRNRLFHHKIDQRNIDLTLLGGANTLCRIALEQMLYWFSLVYTEILRVLAR
jgi:hypothetical protein